VEEYLKHQGERIEKMDKKMEEMNNQLEMLWEKVNE
jgi:hypothetical protein